MAELQKCSRCGAELLPNTLGNHCLRCLLQLGLARDPETEPSGEEAGTIPSNSSGQRPTEKSGDRIGRYRLLRQIGEGGCGVVYMAEQEEPVRRRVALKVIKLGMDTRQVVARFGAERQALALMDHPNIAKVFDAGATDLGRPFFVMELVRGIRITDYCNQNGLDTRERLELFIQVCHAVQHAHQKGVIHRDLKPSNILVAVNDGVAVPKVIDFGIAKATEGRLTGLTLFTAFEQFLGTPAYMSPEQAVLTSTDIDTRTDIYSLGVLLYELLTGTTPFDTKALLAAGLDELRRTIREQEPIRPSTRLSTRFASADVKKVKSRGRGAEDVGLKAEEETPSRRQPETETKELIRQVRGDLDWIVMKCLEKDRARRYETANGLARDIQRHLNNEPVVARPPSRLYEFQKTVRRHKLGFAATAAVITTLAVGVSVSTWQAVQKDRERQRFQNNVVRQYVANGTDLVNQGDLFGSLLWYAEALRLDAGDRRREEPHRIRMASVLRQCPKLLNVFAHGKMLFHAEFSPDGSKVLTTSDDHTARVWDATTGRELLVLRHDGEVYNGTFSQDGLRIVTSSQDKTARVWDGHTGTLIWTLEHQDIVWQSRFSQDGRLVATACQDGTAQLWNAVTGERVGQPLKHESRVDGVTFSPDGHLLGTTTRNGLGYVWDVASGQSRFQGLHFGNGVPFAADSQRFLTFDAQNLRVWNADTLKEFAFSPLKLPNIQAADFGPDGRAIVAASDEFIAQVWDAASGKPLFTPAVRHTGPILNARISPDGRYFATAGQDTVAQVWSITNGKPIGPPLKFILHVKYIDFNADGRRLLGNSCDQAARVWDLATGDLPGPVRPILPNEHRLISPDGHYVLLQGESNTVWITDSRSGQRLAALPHTNGVTYASFSRDGRSVITACERETAVSSMANDIFLWDAQTGRRLNLTSMGHHFRLLYAAFSPDSSRLLTCGFDFTARLWDARTGQPLSDPLRHREQIRWGAFSPDGQSVVTASWDRTARVWDAATGKPLTPPLEHKAAVVGALWSADGRRLSTITEDDNLQVWDLASGEPLTPPRKIQDPADGRGRSGPPEASLASEDLPFDNRPVADLVLLAQMLAVGRIDAGGHVVPLQLQELTGAWYKLRERYPAQFAATASEILAWHRREGQESQTEGNSRAALFHLDRALKLSPGDPVLTEERWHAATMSQGSNSPVNRAAETSRFPVRDLKAGAEQIDLSSHYNLELHRPGGGDFAGLAVGTQTLGGTPFDVRGIIHLNGQLAKQDGAEYPESIMGIRVGRTCRWLHFLQGTGWDAASGTEVGKYVLHYADGQQRELPIIFGRDLENWWFQGAPPEMNDPDGAVTVWTGNNLKAANDGYSIGLYESTRTNPRPDVELESIDFVSSMSPAAPFLVALTVDSAAGRARPAQVARTKVAHDDAGPSRRFAPRDPKAGADQIDISPLYNGALHGSGSADFSGLREALQTLGGVRFDVRGIIYLNGQMAKLEGSTNPERVNSFRIGSKCRRLHFLQGTGWDAQCGTVVGAYVLHYADGQQAELPIVYGQDTANTWIWGLPHAPKEPGGAVAVWAGSNRAAAKSGQSLYLYRSTRENPRPEVELVSIDFVSRMSPASPFLIALTLE
jgi:eukaryotic-like serine/threonine-protein kinase